MCSSVMTQPRPRNDEWNSNRPKEEGNKYDGPAGMEPDGVIDSNWDEVSPLALFLAFFSLPCSLPCHLLLLLSRFARTSTT